MTIGFYNANGKDFDELFEQGGGNRLLYYYTSSGQDIGTRYSPASHGQPGASTGMYYDSNGSDIGPLLCALGKKRFEGSVNFSNRSGLKLISTREESYQTGGDADNTEYRTIGTYSINHGYSAETPTVGSITNGYVYIGDTQYIISKLCTVASFEYNTKYRESYILSEYDGWLSRNSLSKITFKSEIRFTTPLPTNAVITVRNQTGKVEYSFRVNDSQTYGAVWDGETFGHSGTKLIYVHGVNSV